MTTRSTQQARQRSDREGLRQAMSWLHTWAGLVLGWLLFAIFFTGTLSFFRSEFNLWMQPEMHGLPKPHAQVAYKAIDALALHAPGVTQWIMHLPDRRDPAVSVLWRDRPDGHLETLRMHPQTGEPMETRKTMGGDFFYRFHFELRTAHKGRWVIQGRWVVGVATMLMLVALITGVITHRRVFKDFFTFRPGKGGQRAWLDAHNVSGVLVLPFYLLITFSGLMIFHTLYLPAGMAAAYRGGTGVDANAYFADLQGEKAGTRPRRGVNSAAEPLPAIALQPILSDAAARWQGGRIGGVQARRDAHGRAVVEVTRHAGDRLQYRPPRLLYEATTGQWLDQADPTGPVSTAYGVLYGLHMARFAGPGMRWALFGLGVLGSLMIATGLVLWSVKRSAKAQPLPRRNGSDAISTAGAAIRAPLGERLVAALNIGTLVGLPLACAAYLGANRLIPLGTTDRPDAELAWFFGAWGLAFLWAMASAVVRPTRWAWSVPLGVAAGMWAALPLLNALTTPTHLGVTLPQGDWAWAAMDLAFLATGLLMGWLSWRLAPTRMQSAPASPRKPPQASAPTSAAEPAASSA